MEILTLSNIKKMIADFEVQFPRKKIPSYVYMNKNTLQKFSTLVTSIIQGTPNFSGLPIYDIPTMKDGDIDIYNVDNELMHRIRLESEGL